MRKEKNETHYPTRIHEYRKEMKMRDLSLNGADFLSKKCFYKVISQSPSFKLSERASTWNFKNTV